MNCFFAKKKPELADAAIQEPERNTREALMERQRDGSFFSMDDMEVPVGDTYTQERRLLRLVRKGDTMALRGWIPPAPFPRGGGLTASQLRQVKNAFVASATLVSRAAIQGGLSPGDALSLSDMYIQKCESLNSVGQIISLQYQMVQAFTEQVERIRFGGKPTQLAIAVANYIQSHLSQPIRVEEMAKAFYMSRSYLSVKFKEETGQTLTDFILKEKTEEAKYLLRYSDQNATAVASCLGFSSLGHFSQVFKRYTGQTSTEYREKV